MNKLFISFKTAQILQAHRFIRICGASYDVSNGLFRNKPSNNSDIENKIACPTYEEVFKWFREICNIHVSIMPFINYSDDKLYWYFSIYDIDTDSIDCIYDSNDNEYKTYEEAAENAIVYCLTEYNL